MVEKLNIEDLFQQNTFDNSKESNYLFWEAVKDELKFHYDNNEMYRKFCERKSFNPHIDTINHKTIPPVAVSVFKELGANLNSVDKQDIKFSLQSSATSGIPSTIVVDKITSKRQSKAMIRVVQEFIGKERKPFLIMDIDPSSGSRKLLGARFAAVSGYMTFASKVGYFLKEKENGISYFDINAMSEFLKNLPKEQPVIVFGFTYILYSNVLKGINESKNKVKLPKGSKIIHIGGWKKLESEKLAKIYLIKDLLMFLE
jgi:Acyl-protein synthetase, LuxE.